MRRADEIVLNDDKFTRQCRVWSTPDYVSCVCTVKVKVGIVSLNNGEVIGGRLKFHDILLKSQLASRTVEFTPNHRNETIDWYPDAAELVDIQRTARVQ